jgi:hypothetical protein
VPRDYAAGVEQREVGAVVALGTEYLTSPATAASGSRAVLDGRHGDPRPSSGWGSYPRPSPAMATADALARCARSDQSARLIVAYSVA